MSIICLLTFFCAYLQYFLLPLEPFWFLIFISTKASEVLLTTLMPRLYPRPTKLETQRVEPGIHIFKSFLGDSSVWEPLTRSLFKMCSGSYLFLYLSMLISPDKPTDKPCFVHIQLLIVLKFITLLMHFVSLHILSSFPGINSIPLK